MYVPDYMHSQTLTQKRRQTYVIVSGARLIRPIQSVRLDMLLLEWAV